MQDVFGDCLYTRRDAVSFGLGLGSIGACARAGDCCAVWRVVSDDADSCGLCFVARVRAGCWLVAQLPQVVANHRAASAEALSPWFLVRSLRSLPQSSAHAQPCFRAVFSRHRLARSHARAALSPPLPLQAEWLLGDTCNLLGCLLTGSQLPTQTFTACYYLGMDVVMVSQFAFYARAAERRRRADAAAVEEGGQARARACACVRVRASCA